jgi:hypothetical protein
VTSAKRRPVSRSRPAPGSVVVVRTIVLLLLVVAGISFAFFAFTGQAKYKRFGLIVLKWTLGAALVFFAALFVQTLVER